MNYLKTGLLKQMFMARKNFYILGLETCVLRLETHVFAPRICVSGPET